MELVMKDISYLDYLKEINISFKSSIIYGVFNGENLIKVLKDNRLLNNGEIYLLDGKITKQTIAFISSNDFSFYTAKVRSEIVFQSGIRNYKDKHIKDRINKLLNELELSPDILNRVFHSLSTSEKYLINILINLVYEPSIIIFEEVMEKLDYKNTKIVKRLISKLKELGKIVILTSSDSNILQQLTEEIIIFRENKVLCSGYSDDIYSNIGLLLENNVQVPYLSLLTYKAKEKKDVNLFYRKDVRDTIKDIYKSV